MLMKKVVIITPFDNYSYQVRIKYVEKYFINRGYKVIIVSSDFDHRNKKKYSVQRENLELLHVTPYRKNMSIARIVSHRQFAKKCFGKLEELNPDIIYCSVPPNYLIKYTSKYKRKSVNNKLIFELGDLWPETLPLQSSIKKIATPLLRLWAGIRNTNIHYSDAVIYECQLFRDRVSGYHPNVYSKVVYLSKTDYYKGGFELPAQYDDTYKFAYVGSINNIIDIDLITNIMSAIQKRKKAELVIIGDGENRNRFLSMCEEKNIKYVYHGIVYDEEQKHKILSECQFGFNIMKNNVAVGATMKSLEYFHEGLIVINTIPYDTQDIINQYKCGYNIVNGSYKEFVDCLLNMDTKSIATMRKQSRLVYETLFDPSTIDLKLDEVMTNIGVLS